MSEEKEKVSKKSSIIQTKTSNIWSGYTAIAIAMKYHEWEVRGNAQQNRWKDLIARKSAQEKLTIELCMDFDLDPRNSVNNEVLIHLDQKIDYQIIVIEENEQSFVGTDREKVIYLLKSVDLFAFIKSMPGYWRRNHYCKYCNRCYSRNDHRCKEINSDIL
jgi:hypothetical protein